MKKRQLIKIIIRATVALSVPILGQLFVNGWNWGLVDFIFAWVFFIIFGVTYTVVVNKISHRWSKVAAGIIVVAIFTSIWVTLATG